MREMAFCFESKHPLVVRWTKNYERKNTARMRLPKLMGMNIVRYLKADVSEIKFYALAGKRCLNSPGVLQLYPGNERDGRFKPSGPTLGRRLLSLSSVLAATLLPSLVLL